MATLNTGVVVLAIVNSVGLDGTKSVVTTTEITRTFLALRRMYDLEAIDTRPGSIGLESSRLNSIVGVFTVRGFLTDDLELTASGERWMHTKLEEIFSTPYERRTFHETVHAALHGNCDLAALAREFDGLTVQLLDDFSANMNDSARLVGRTHKAPGGAWIEDTVVGRMVTGEPGSNTSMRMVS